MLIVDRVVFPVNYTHLRRNILEKVIPIITGSH
ncbi:hypothetical protein CLV98_10479 [Dyadobacter jejuensis]|uniref:Uncharacterized protein n=1 Tax=Dyadobacter jejuensis TaxID=1082580 RepID=A0A316AL06_9BACT|nr:hypothetical protein CLV98_10479 [Dyadobacter jejuensis]